jgi:antitoxin MazE
MKTKAQKWGNSLAVRLPRPVAQKVGIKLDDPLEIQISKGRVVLIPSSAPEYRLSDLLKKVTKKNIHHETDWGKPRGKEIW